MYVCVIECKCVSVYATVRCDCVEIVMCVIVSLLWFEKKGINLYTCFAFASDI